LKDFVPENRLSDVKRSPQCGSHLKRQVDQSRRDAVSSTFLAFGKTPRSSILRRDRERTLLGTAASSEPFSEESAKSGGTTT